MAKQKARRKISHLMSKSINVFNGQKSLDTITYTESPLEADFCYHLEFDDNVKNYLAQPLSVDYYFEGALHSYTPDFEVFYNDGTVCYFEVKYIADIGRNVHFDAWESAIRKASGKLGKGFIVIKEDFIRKEFLYENLQTLYASSDINVEKEFLVHINQIFQDQDQVTIIDLMTDSASDSELEQIYRFIFDKLLITNLNCDFLSKQTIVDLNGKGYEQYL